MAMELIGSYAQNGAQWSPVHNLVAGMSENRIIIRDRTGAMIQVFICADVVDAFSWSPDGNYICCEIRSKGLVHIFHLHSKKTARIEEGLAGLSSAQWIPNGKILTVTDFGVRACIWDLETKKCEPLQEAPKHAKALPLSPDNKWIAYIFRNKADRVAVISAHSPWDRMSDFLLALSDAASLSWTEDSTKLVIIESTVTCRCAVYSIAGDQLISIEPYATLATPTFALGIKMMEIGEGICALALHNNTIHIFCLKSLKPLGVLEARWDDKNAHFYQETLVNASSRPAQTQMYDLGLPLEDLPGLAGGLGDEDVHLRLMQGAKHSPKMLKKGFSFMSFDWKKRYIAARCDGAPGNVCAFIWDTYRLSLHSVIVFRTPIKHMAWAPTSSTLAVATNDSRLYFWSPHGVHTYGLENALTGAIRWCPHSSLLVLQSREKTSVFRISVDKAGGYDGK